MKTLIKIILLLAAVLAVYLTATDQWGRVADLGRDSAGKVAGEARSMKDSAGKGVEKAVDAVKDKANELGR